MLFMSDNPQKTGPKVEAKLRKELRSSEPIRYSTMLDGQYAPGSLGQAASDVLNGVLADLWIGGTRPLHTLRFDVVHPRRFELNVQIIKAQAVVIGGLLYTAVIHRPVNGALALEEEKTFSKSKMVGDPAAANKINAVKSIIGALNFLARDRYVIADTEIISKRYATLVPIGIDMSLLSVSTMPRSKYFNLSSTFDAPAFVELLNQVEAALV